MVPYTQKRSVNALFFSEENINRLQKHIKKEVHIKTRGEYKLEADLILDTIMKETSAEHGRNNKHVIRFTKKLNNIVVNNTVPSLISNIKRMWSRFSDPDHYQQLRNIRPINISNTRRATLPSVRTTWS